MVHIALVTTITPPQPLHNISIHSQVPGKSDTCDASIKKLPLQGRGETNPVFNSQMNVKRGREEGKEREREREKTDMFIKLRNMLVDCVVVVGGAR
jgi:hypothetical protein